MSNKRLKDRNHRAAARWLSEARGDPNIDEESVRMISAGRGSNRRWWLFYCDQSQFTIPGLCRKEAVVECIPGPESGDIHAECFDELPIADSPFHTEVDAANESMGQQVLRVHTRIEELNDSYTSFVEEQGNE